MVDRLPEEIEVMKPDHVAVRTQLGDLGQDMMLRQIDLWGERIIPAVQQAVRLGRAEVAAAAA